MVKATNKKKDDQFTLADFIRQQMKIHGLETEREVAAFTGLSPSTIHKHLSEPEKRTAIETLERLSKAFHVSLEALILVVSPEFARKSPIPPRTLILAEQIVASGADQDTINLSFALALSHKPKRDTK